VSPARARDFSRWIQITDKRRLPGPGAGTPNPVTGKPRPGAKYAASTRGHSESVLRGFYEFHLEVGSGPMVNPFPLARRRGRAHAHHNPLEPYRNERSGLYRPQHVQRVPHSIPDEKFNELFAQLPSHSDRALVALWVSSGARASELLGCRRRDADPGQQLITVVRKGTRAVQQVPASPDAFVWLRLYQAQMHGLVSARPTIRCGGRSGGRSGRWPITPFTGCSAGPTPRWAPTGPCMTCGTRPPTGWPATRRCR
jgi:integrase